MQRFIEGIVDSPFAMLWVVLYAAVGLITGVWVAVNASKHRISTYGNDYNVNTGPVAWFLGCLFLWPLVVPVYFVRRAAVTRGEVEQPSLGEPSSLGRAASSIMRNLIALGILVACSILGGVGGWYLGWSVFPAPSPFGALAMVGPGVLVGLLVGWALSRWVF
jgi:hypothetical protein